MRREPPGQRRGCRFADIVDHDLGRAVCGERCGDRRTDAPSTDDETARTADDESLAVEPGDEPQAIEELAMQRAVGTLHDRVARAGRQHRIRPAVEQRDDRDLVRHRDDQAVQVGDRAEGCDSGRKVSRAQAHRDHGGIDAVGPEPGVVDELRLDDVDRVAEMGIQRRRTADDAHRGRRLIQGHRREGRRGARHRFLQAGVFAPFVLCNV